MSDGPKRRFEVAITVEADDWEEVEREIVWASGHLVSHGPKCNSAGGGFGRSHRISVVEHPEQTHERFADELDAYCRELKEKKRAAMAEAER